MGEISVSMLQLPQAELPPSWGHPCRNLVSVFTHLLLPGCSPGESGDHGEWCPSGQMLLQRPMPRLHHPAVVMHPRGGSSGERLLRFKAAPSLGK